jgi:hypothetical protein
MLTRAIIQETLAAFQWPLSARRWWVAGIALDRNGWQVVQQFYFANTGGFLLLLLESCKCNKSPPLELFPPSLETGQSNTFNQ